MKNKIEIGFDEWRACGRGNKWNVRDKAGALLLETQDGYADHKLTAKDAERIAKIAASAPEMLAMLERVFKVMPARMEEGGELLEGHIAGLIAKLKGGAS